MHNNNAHNGLNGFWGSLWKGVKDTLRFVAESNALPFTASISGLLDKWIGGLDKNWATVGRGVVVKDYPPSIPAHLENVLDRWSKTFYEAFTKKVIVDLVQKYQNQLLHPTVLPRVNSTLKEIATLSIYYTANSKKPGVSSDDKILFEAKAWMVERLKDFIVFTFSQNNTGEYHFKRVQFDPKSTNRIGAEALNWSFISSIVGGYQQINAGVVTTTTTTTNTNTNTNTNTGTTKPPIDATVVNEPTGSTKPPTRGGTTTTTTKPPINTTVGDQATTRPPVNTNPTVKPTATTQQSTATPNNQNNTPATPPKKSNNILLIALAVAGTYLLTKKK